MTAPPSRTQPPSGSRATVRSITSSASAELIEQKRVELKTKLDQHSISFDDYMDITSKMAAFEQQFQPVKKHREFKQELSKLVVSELQALRSQTNHTLNA